MIGNNTMTINEATKVSSVKPAPTGGGYGHTNDFEVRVEGKEPVAV